MQPARGGVRARPPRILLPGEPGYDGLEAGGPARSACRARTRRRRARPAAGAVARRRSRPRGPRTSGEQRAVDAAPRHRPQPRRPGPRWARRRRPRTGTARSSRSSRCRSRARATPLRWTCRMTSRAGRRALSVPSIHVHHGGNMSRAMTAAAHRESSRSSTASSRPSTRRSTRAGQPITWPVTPYYRPGAGAIDVTTGIGYPKKADDAAAQPAGRAAVLRPDRLRASTMPPMVLVQGTAEVDDRDLDANRERYQRESVEKLPATKKHAAAEVPAAASSTGTSRASTCTCGPSASTCGTAATSPPSRELLRRASSEEVRSGHSEEPAASHAGARGRRRAVGTSAWTSSATRYPHAVLSLVAPDGFPVLGAGSDRGGPGRPARPARRRAAGRAARRPGLACLTAHDHAPRLHVAAQLPGARRPRARTSDGWSLCRTA